MSAALSIIMNPFVPESPKWLVANGHFKEAREVLLKIAKMNKREIPKELLDSVVPDKIVQANEVHEKKDKQERR